MKGTEGALCAGGIEASFNSQAIESFRAMFQVEVKLTDKELGELKQE